MSAQSCTHLRTCVSCTHTSLLPDSLCLHTYTPCTIQLLTKDMRCAADNNPQQQKQNPTETQLHRNSDKPPREVWQTHTHTHTMHKKANLLREHPLSYDLAKALPRKSAHNFGSSARTLPWPMLVSIRPPPPIKLQPQHRAWRQTAAAAADHSCSGRPQLQCRFAATAATHKEQNSSRTALGCHLPLTVELPPGSSIVTSRVQTIHSVDHQPGGGVGHCPCWEHVSTSNETVQTTRDKTYSCSDSRNKAPKRIGDAQSAAGNKPFRTQQKPHHAAQLAFWLKSCHHLHSTAASAAKVMLAKHLCSMRQCQA